MGWTRQRWRGEMGLVVAPLGPALQCWALLRKLPLLSYLSPGQGRWRRNGKWWKRCWTMRSEGMYLRRRQVGGKISGGSTVAQMTRLLLLMWRQLMEGQRQLRRPTLPRCYIPDTTSSSAFHPMSLCGCQHIQFWGGLHCLTQLPRRAEQVTVSL